MLPAVNEEPDNPLLSELEAGLEGAGDPPLFEVEEAVAADERMAASILADPRVTEDVLAAAALAGLLRRLDLFVVAGSIEGDFAVDAVPHDMTPERLKTHLLRLRRHARNRRRKHPEEHIIGVILAGYDALLRRSLPGFVERSPKPQTLVAAVPREMVAAAVRAEVPHAFEWLPEEQAEDADGRRLRFVLAGSTAVTFGWMRG